MARVLGLDIGGANLKAAHGDGAARQAAFALWRTPELLLMRLRELIEAMPACEVLAVTMTGELCDCFASRGEGVAFILEALEEAAGQRRIRVWSTRGQFLTLNDARAVPLHVASANWLALAVLACRFVKSGPGVLIDIGSTTTDIVALDPDRPRPKGLTDRERLRTGELVYVGVRRTPLWALLSPAAIPELFATALDAYLVLGLVPDDVDDTETADGRPATRACARQRIARMVGADADMLSETEIEQLALQACTQQVKLIRAGLEKVLRKTPAGTVILAGAGEFLARFALRQLPLLTGSRILSLAEELGPEMSRAACAYAVARLAIEEEHADGCEGRR